MSQEIREVVTYVPEAESRRWKRIARERLFLIGLYAAFNVWVLYLLLRDEVR